MFKWIIFFLFAPFLCWWFRKACLNRGFTTALLYHNYLKDDKIKNTWVAKAFLPNSLEANQFSVSGARALFCSWSWFLFSAPFPFGVRPWQAGLAMRDISSSRPPFTKKCEPWCILGRWRFFSLSQFWTHLPVSSATVLHCCHHNGTSKAVT